MFFGSADSLKIGDLGLVTKSGLDGGANAKCIIDRNESNASIHTDNVGTRGYMSPEQVIHYNSRLLSISA